MITPAALRLIFTEIPFNVSDAVRFMLDFYRCGKPVKTGKRETMLSGRRAYDALHDFPYIAAAFLEQYGIDLWEIPYMHYFKFRALFDGLHDTRFTEIAGYRTAEISSDTPAYRAEHISRMQELFALPRTVNEERMTESVMKYYERS